MELDNIELNETKQIASEERHCFVGVTEDNSLCTNTYVSQTTILSGFQMLSNFVESSYVASR